MDNIDFSKITACGENCTECKKKATGNCEGCIETGGKCKEWTESKGCPVAMCARTHEVQFCGLCKNFPCNLLITKITWNPNVVEQQKKLAEQYWHEDLVQLIKEEDEQNYGSNVADCCKTTYGQLFYAEENPTMHDANHAVINKEDNLDNDLEQIKDFYLSKELTPRVYLKDGQYERIKECLIVHGFCIENVGKFERFLLTKKSKINKTNNLVIKIAKSCDSIDDRLLNNINEAYLISEPDARDRLKYSLQRIVNGDDKLYIGYDKSGEPVTIAVLSYTGNGLCYLDSVETGIKYRGNGYCRELISKIVEDCKNPLFLSSENPTAIKIYKEAGFTPIKHRENNTYWRAYYKK